MSNINDMEKDILKRYINSESIEKAPEGFSEKVMGHIQTEKAPVAATRKSLSRILVPAIYVTITLCLILAAVIFAAPSDSLVFSTINKFFTGINLKMPELAVSSIPALSMPAIIVYVLVGFFLLTLFDGALNRLFRRGR